MKIIEVENLSAYYELKPVFSGLSFTVNAGDYLCVVGENGSGKTTLMRCILGLTVKHSGIIRYNGITNKSIGWLPQQTGIRRDFPAGVFEVVMSGFSGKHFLGIGCGKIHRNKAADIMRELGVLELANRPFSELSGGQQRRVLLARALCAAQNILLLDEPASALDAAAQEEMYSVIKELNRRGTTIIMITHDIARAVRSATHILSLSDNGFFYGTSKQFSEEEGNG